MNYYAERIAEYGVDVRALGWSSPESQRTRFKVLSEIGDLEGSSILDYGCGFGDLFGYLRNAGVHYFGYDNDPQMILAARQRYPGVQFVDRPVSADYVLESGAFNLTDQWQSEVSELWKLCRKGAALNFTSNLAERQTAGIVYADPFDTARFCSGLTKRFSLRHDYKANDFTVYLYKS